jgi:rhamnose transport system ATP-binding protein
MTAGARAPGVLLAATGIHKQFAGVRALDGVSFDLVAGEVHALVGENGAGKSTLIKILTGAHRPDAGTIVTAGEPVSEMTPTRAHALGIAAIYQHPALFPDLTVAENLAFALDSGALWHRVDWRRRRERAGALLSSLGADVEPDRLVSTLSMPEQQLVEIAKAVGADARVLLMDEPTASLTDREVSRLFQIIANLRAGGVGIIYISHRLEEVFAIADRITVLRDGRSIGTRPRAETSMSDVVQLMVGRTLEAPAPRLAAPVRGEIALELRGVSSRAGGVNDISLTVRRGEIVGLAGLVGSGRTELAEVIFGLRSRDAGDIRLHGAPADIRNPRDAIRLGLAYLPEDRLRNGIVAEMSVASNTSLASLAAVARAGLIDRTREVSLARHYVERFRIRTPDVETDTGLLSGGNQQKVALARWLATNPSVLIADEPTQGVDVGSKAGIHALLRELTAGGMAILLISSELPEILALSDRVAVMRAGAIAGTFTRAEATEARILGLALAVPPASPAGARC